MFDALSLGKLGCEVLGQRQILILSGRAKGPRIRPRWQVAGGDRRALAHAQAELLEGEVPCGDAALV